MNKTVPSIWIIGYSQAGKTTLGRLLVEKLRARGCGALCIDGDEIRAIHDNNLGFDPISRRKQTTRVKRLAKWVASQQIIPVVSIVHPFENDRITCREEIPGYYEVYLRCDLKELIGRDNKKIYLPALRGEKKNVIGVDIPYDEPMSADLTLDSDKNKPEQLLQMVWHVVEKQLLPSE